MLVSCGGVTYRFSWRKHHLRGVSCLGSLLYALSWSTALSETAEPLLDVMYLKYKQQPIDTTPTFDRMVEQYHATLDWKMKYFSVQATPLGDAVIRNIHLCPEQANCLAKDQTIVTMDFSRNILVEPGSTILYHFDVMLKGSVRRYAITVHRLQGNETDLTDMNVRGASPYPGFKSQTRNYECKLGIGTESALIELDLLDQGQTILAAAQPPLPLAPTDNITNLPSSARRLSEEIFGEFQYPKKFIEFPVPMGTKRTINIKIISSDGGHFGYYSLSVGRESCKEQPGMPLFDVTSLQCVRFCNTGYWPDYEASRCKRCPDDCISCLPGHSEGRGPRIPRCVLCPQPTSLSHYILDNVSGTCIAQDKAIWEETPERFAALLLAFGGICIFSIGLCGFQWATPQTQKRRDETDFRNDSKNRSFSTQQQFASQANLAPGRGFLRGPISAGYAKVASEDLDSAF